MEFVIKSFSMLAFKMQLLMHEHVFGGDEENILREFYSCMAFRRYFYMLIFLMFVLWWTDMLEFGQTF